MKKTPRWPRNGQRIAQAFSQEPNGDGHGASFFDIAVLMHGYSQPLEYKFSHDSIELAQRGARILRERRLRPSDRGSLRVLDLCAGCGVVGLELVKEILRGARTVEPIFSLEIDFNEVQEIYRPHFEINRQHVQSLASHGHLAFAGEWVQSNYTELLKNETLGLYDLVLSNPPYFDREQGSLPPSQFKARCRFFLDSDFTTLLRVTAHVLRPGGEALILVRDIGDHGRSRESVLNDVLNPLGIWTWAEPIRGTGLLHFVRR